MKLNGSLTDGDGNVVYDGDTNAITDKARQHAQTAYKDVNNAFSTKQSVVSATANALFGLTTSGQVDWTMGIDRAAGGQLKFALSTDLSNPKFVLSTPGHIVQFGGNITFPASQDPSADANTLDDYEEGTWTPDLNFGGAAVGLTFNARVGQYVKIGRFVMCWMRIDVDQKGSSTGTANLTGLPFTIENNTALLAGGMATHFSAMSSITGFPAVRLNINTATGVFVTGGATVHTDLTQANFNTGSQVIAQFSFYVNL